MTIARAMAAAPYRIFLVRLIYGHNADSKGGSKHERQPEKYEAHRYLRFRRRWPYGSEGPSRTVAVRELRIPGRYRQVALWYQKRQIDPSVRTAGGKALAAKGHQVAGDRVQYGFCRGARGVAKGVAATSGDGCRTAGRARSGRGTSRRAASRAGDRS